ncbi:MAG TPA: hypothetical protein VLN73_08935 [Alphaproteobacteria bacterium]|nr:hypothetical protein [Alphaproteobacteria bacterium]
MDDFYAVRSRFIPPLPWKTFSPPLSIPIDEGSICLSHVSNSAAELLEDNH